MPNLLANVCLPRGGVTSSRIDGSLQYATTAHMQWSAIDYVDRIGRSPVNPIKSSAVTHGPGFEAVEIWTFVRLRGNNWLLSAIQQL